MLEYDIAIIGKGTAALFLAEQLYNLNTKLKTCIIGTNYGNSLMSPWNIRTSIKYYKEQFENNFDNEVNIGLKKYFIDVYEDKVISFLDKYKDNLVKNIFGYRLALNVPGSVILKNIEEKIRDKIDIIHDLVYDIEYGNNNYSLFLKKGQLKARKLVIATGGLGFNMKDSTGLKLSMPNIFDMLPKINVKVDKLDSIMYHPFMIKTKIGFKLIAGTMVVPYIFYKVNKDGIESKLFPEEIQKLINLNDYHHIFNKMLVYMKDAIDNGYKIIGKNTKSIENYKKYISTNEYSYVLNYLDDKDIIKAEFKLGYHYLLGGVVVDDNLCSVTNKDVFALGESVCDFYLGNRPGGMGHTDSIVLSEMLAKTLNKL